MHLDPTADGLPQPEMFGDALTADHKILNDDNTSRDHDKLALIIKDVF